MKFLAYVFGSLAFLRIVLVGLLFVLAGLGVISSQDVYNLFHVVVSQIFIFYGILLWIPFIMGGASFRKDKKNI